MQANVCRKEKMILEEKKQKNAELNKARYEERKKKGLCVKCGKPCMRGKVGSSPSRKKKSIYCKEHYDMMAEYYKEKRRRNKLQKELDFDMRESE